MACRCPWFLDVERRRKNGLLKESRSSTKPKGEPEVGESGPIRGCGPGMVALHEEPVLVPPEDEVGDKGGGGDAHGDAADLAHQGWA